LFQCAGLWLTYLKIQPFRTTGLYEEKARQKQVELEEEFADVLSYLLDLANCFQVDLEKAFREKDRLNQTRTWD
jgi:NTP pyrophosphatase (non-canonical NTP hydrolase)